MTDALRYEWVRLRTLRSTYWLVGSTIALTMVVAALVGWFGRGDDLGPDVLVIALTAGVAFSPLPLTAVLLGILGVMATGHEYRHGTIAPTLGTLPRRSVVVTAKLALVVVVCAVTAVVSLALGIGVLAAFRGGDLDLGSPLPAALGGYVLLLLLWGVLGAAATLLLRNMVLVIVLLLVIPLIVEQVLAGVTLLVPALEGLQPATRFLPFTAGSQLAQSIDLASQDFGGTDIPTPLTRWENGGVFAAFVALVLVPAWLLFERRDA